jgi:DNA repair protein RecN (Recombination protein N)
MLQALHIQNFALIADLHVSFSDGVTIFTGETGAGKSILLDAIGMLAGKRASAEFVRHGTEAFLVEGLFCIQPNPELMQLLESHHVECEQNQLILSRKFSRYGRGSILINGTLSPMSLIRKIGPFLLDIHGQYDNHLIFDSEYHVHILDGLTPELVVARKDYDGLYHQWRQLQRDMEAMQRDDSEKARLMSVLRFQISEIQEADLKDQEDELLEEKINRLSHAEKILAVLQASLHAFNGGERRAGLVEQVTQMHLDLDKAAAYDDVFKTWSQKLETVSYELEDVRDEVERYAEEFTFNEGEMDSLQSRLAAIEKLKRKYGYSIEKIKEFLEKSKVEFNRLEQSESILEELKTQSAAVERAVREAAAKLFKLRQAADATFRQQMKSTLSRLGMADSYIGFHLEPMTGINAIGADGVELYFTANKGEAPLPLAKIASGGEVSRIALALKTCTPHMGAGKTVIFDEIDVGISGQTGLQVGKHIRKLRERGQVFCITHLPQTAAIADQHVFLYKQEEQGRTVTLLRQLSPEEHVREIARMFAGNTISDASVTAARQLIKQVRD